MSTSTYSITRDEIILTALRKLGAVEPGDTAATIDSNIVTNCAQALNLMVKQWMTEGIKLWTVIEYTITPVTNQTEYIVGPSGPDLVADRPLRLIQGVIRNIAATPYIDTPLQILSKQEYMTLGSKFSTGIANSVYLNPGSTSASVKLFLTPDVTTSTNYVIILTCQRPIYDISTATTVPDFPNEWMQALVWGLADQLSLEFGLPINHRQEVMLRAEKYKDQLTSWDIENESTFFQPDSRNFTSFGR
jgi:hypothetical protein